MTHLLTRVLGASTAIADVLADLVLSQSCAGCGSGAGRNGAHRAALCAACDTALAGPAHVTRPDPCPDGFPPTFAVAAYDGPVRAALLAHKERRRFALTRPLGTALARSLTAATGQHERVLVVPVPSSRIALRERGHDPTGRLVLAGTAAARRAGARVTRLRALRHARRAADQAGLSSAERAANLKGAFQAVPTCARLLAGARVVVADDVVTTGVTLVEAARALQAAGAIVAGAAVVAATQRRLRLGPDDPSHIRPMPYPFAGDGR